MTDPELHIFDEFEAVEYERSSVEVSLMVSTMLLLFDVLGLHNSR